jgi:hypothetical protein
VSFERLFLSHPQKDHLEKFQNLLSNFKQINKLQGDNLPMLLTDRPFRLLMLVANLCLFSLVVLVVRLRLWKGLHLLRLN